MYVKKAKEENTCGRDGKIFQVLFVLLTFLELLVGLLLALLLSSDLSIELLALAAGNDEVWPWP